MSANFYQGKKVLVTGGAGFIGTHIIEALLKYGALVRVTIHNRPLIVKDSRLEVFHADLTRQQDCLSAAKDVDYIFHAAGSVGAASVDAAQSMALITTNLILTAQMLQAAWNANVERFLLFGSSAAYPPAGYPVKEEEMFNGPVHPSYSGYGWLRRYLEKLGEFVFSKSNLKIAIVRPTAVYGRWDNFDPKTCHVIPALIRKAVEKVNPYEVWGSGDEVRDFLHVSDLADASLLALEKQAICDPVNIGYGQGIAIKELVKIIIEASGYENAQIIFNSSKPSTIPFRLVDTLKAKSVLGFEPKVPLEEGLRDTIRWYADAQLHLRY